MVFEIPRPTMDAFWTRRQDTRSNNGQMRGTPRGTHGDVDDDTAPLSPRSASNAHNRDVEAQQEMAERPATRFMPRIPSIFSVASSRPRESPQSTPQIPRPTSSRYSEIDEHVLETPKTPRFRIGAQALPSTRLHLPNLARTWTQGSSGPPTRPPSSHSVYTHTTYFPSGTSDVTGVQSPAPAAAAQHLRTYGASPLEPGQDIDQQFGSEEMSEVQGHRRDHGRRRGHRSHRSGRRHRSRNENGEQDGGRQRRRRERPQQDGQERPTPKRFLFCFPWVKSRRMRNMILRCFVSGLFLILLLTVYLALSISNNINSNEFTVLLILVILFGTIFFCHSLIRLCIFIIRGGRQEGNARSGRPFGHSGYAIPREPIRVVLARDEEAAGIESEAVKTSPPAYGLWRESVRVDPDRIYWARNEGANLASQEEEAAEPETRSSAGSSDDTRNERTGLRRPPSYSSDDGVSYVVEAQPRSIAPTTDVPLTNSAHPSEAGRAGHAPNW